MKYGNPSKMIWENMKMGNPSKGYGTMKVKVGGKTKKVRTMMKWSSTDAMGLKSFREGTSVKKLRKVM